ncbi:MAG: DUF4395 domain-containing protein [Bacteroidota bacterium]|nr:DUF4395 domain-containing protein [Bacteroidota bacterium]
MKLISFGEYKNNSEYKVLDERHMRAGAGIMFLLGLFAFINGFILNNYTVIPYISGFLVLNFLLGLLINPRIAPTRLIAHLLVRKQTPLYVGAVQKKFAWILGLLLVSVVFGLSFLLLGDVSYFGPICMLCIICLTLLFFETAFGICIGCKFYHLFIRLKVIPKPDVNPSCTGDACEV